MILELECAPATFRKQRQPGPGSLECRDESRTEDELTTVNQTTYKTCLCCEQLMCSKLHIRSLINCSAISNAHLFSIAILNAIIL